MEFQIWKSTLAPTVTGYSLCRGRILPHPFTLCKRYQLNRVTTTFGRYHQKVSLPCLSLISLSGLNHSQDICESTLESYEYEERENSLGEAEKQERSDYGWCRKAENFSIFLSFLLWRWGLYVCACAFFCRIFFFWWTYQKLDSTVYYSFALYESLSALLVKENYRE